VTPEHLERRITLRCGHCHYTWLALIWRQGDAESAERSAARCWCPACEAKPPHAIVTAQGELFAEVA
jgi:hypothetical protein